MNKENEGIWTTESLKIHNINSVLLDNLEGSLTSPIVGIMVIRKVLDFFKIRVPLLFDLDSEGSEFILEINDLGELHDIYDVPPKKDHKFLYVVYFRDDLGEYHFHAEITDLTGIEDIIRDTEDNPIDV